MARIRSHTVPNNVQGRVSTHFTSPYSGATHYATIEDRRVTLRHYDTHQIGREEQDDLGIVPLEMEVSYVGRTAVVVTVGGYHAGSQDSAQETFLIDVSE